MSTPLNNGDKNSLGNPFIMSFPRKKYFYRSFIFEVFGLRLLFSCFRPHLLLFTHAESFVSLSHFFYDCTKLKNLSTGHPKNFENELFFWIRERTESWWNCQFGMSNVLRHIKIGLFFSCWYSFGNEVSNRIIPLIQRSRERKLLFDCSFMPLILSTVFDFGLSVCFCNH